MTPDDFRASLERIAQSVAMLPGGLLSFYFGVNDEAVELIAAIGGVRRRTLYSQGYSIDGAGIVVGGVDFQAQSKDRPLTDDERARLATDGRETVTRYVTVTP